MKWEKPPKARPEAELIDPDTLAPPEWQSWSEVAWHLPRMLAGLGHLGPRGPEDGPPALVVPGFLANDRSTMDLRRALALGGWRAHPWLLGFNRGAKAETMDQLASRIEAIFDGRKVLLVGWSLGGMFARELAWRVPDRIRAVVTLGSPFSGDYKTNTNIREFYERIAGHDVNRAAVRAPFTASRRCRCWRSGRGSTGSSLRRPRAAPRARSTRRSRSPAATPASRSTGAAMSRIVREIRAFLTAVEGKSPV